MNANTKNNDRPELIFGLVGQAGVEIGKFSDVLRDHLKTFGYTTKDIKLSMLLDNYSGLTIASDDREATRIMHLQEMGLNFRKAINDGAALARAAISKIREERINITGNPDIQASNYAFVLNQLKHPDEVELLRKVYGSSFILLAGHAPKSVRTNNLTTRLKTNNLQGRYVNEDVQHIIIEDEKQLDELGQNTRDTYPLADYFASFERNQTETTVARFIDLLFGHPFHTPFPEEYAMYQAYASSLRSSDESRQVGAVIVKLSRSESASNNITNVDIVASGMNEVPRRGGGFYWQGDSPDGRDQFQKRWNNPNLADNIKLDVLAELIEKFQENKLFNEKTDATKSHELAHSLLKSLKGTQFMNIGEFMRTVHAEMAALIDSARRGVAVNDLSMYVTTFPCHNCAKHIIAAGLKRVVYLEPYPKSRAETLHGEEIDIEPDKGIAQGEKVAFIAFTGVAPRQYQQLFSMSRRSPRVAGLPIKKWDAEKMSLSPMYIEKNASAAYLLAERQELEKLSTDVYKWDKAKICPELN